MNKYSFPRLTLIFSLLTSFVFADVFNNIKPGEWYEVPNSKLDPLAPVPMPDGNWGGFKAVMLSWSGGGYDNKRDRLLIWGGGHHDYGGNEIYGFDINNLLWSRLSPSSTDFSGDEKTGEYPDGLPRARHTYDYVQYVPKLDAFCTFGGQVMFPSGQMSTSVTHCFDFGLNKWIRKNLGAIGSIGGLSAVEEATGKVWTLSAGGIAKLMEWNYTLDTWIPHATYDVGWLDYYYTAAAGAGKFIAIGLTAAGKKQMIIWNLSSPDLQPIVSELPAKVIIGSSPGFVFDSKRNLFVAWSGGTKVFVLNPLTLSWDEILLASTNKVLPSTGESHGTFGRFRYVASKDLFIGVNRTAENVYLFRMPSAIQLDIKKNFKKKDKNDNSIFLDLKGRDITFSKISNGALFRKSRCN